MDFWNALVTSFGLILACEIGDRTFFIAAILSMKHPAVVIFSGALSALAVMTVLSAGLGVLLPSLLSRKVTHYVCSALFLYFGSRLLWDACHADNGENEELHEVELELGGGNQVQLDEEVLPPSVSAAKATDKPELVSDTIGAVSNEDVEPMVQERNSDKQEAQRDAGESGPSVVPGAKKVDRGPYLAAFVMTFLAEWGDRSQIATIALGAANDPIGVCIGGVAGHSICTGIACIGGKLLAQTISERYVSFFGGLLFLFFGFLQLFMGPPASEPVPN